MTELPYQKYICRVCGFVYDEAQGDPDSGLAPGTRYDDIPDDWYCPLCGVSKIDMVLLEDVQQSSQAETRVSSIGIHQHQSFTDSKHAIVIVGSGIAGWTTVREIRERDKDTPIILICAASADSYPKPLLSMAYAQQREPDSIVETSAQILAAELSICLREHTKVVAINRARKRLLTTRGSLYYDKLILATGARQATVRCRGDGAGDIHYVNDLESYRELRVELQQPGRRVTIIGAGLIGCELAEDLTRGGHEITLIERGSQPLLQLLPRAMAESLRQQLSERGIHCQVNRDVDVIDRAENGLLITFKDGGMVEADVVIGAIGLIPNTRLATSAGLDCRRGILVDEKNMRSSDPDIYAIGDCAQIAHQCFSYIEPIHRQARTLSASLTEKCMPFATFQPLIRVKTPSLPLVVCPPPPTQHTGHWLLVKADAKGHYMAFLSNGRLFGFALSGNFTQYGQKLYADVIASVQAESEASASQQLSA